MTTSCVDVCEILTERLMALGYDLSDHDDDEIMAALAEVILVRKVGRKEVRG